MPSERFFNLPAGKREKITKAAVEEFSSEPMEAVSINRIVRSAGISRGSFYTYFEDKQDVLDYLGNTLEERYMSAMKDAVKKSGGDLFLSFDYFLQKIMTFMEENKPVLFRKHAAIHQNHDPLHAVEIDLYGDSRKECAEHMRWLRMHLDMKRLNVQSDREFRALLLMCQINVMIAAAEFRLRPEYKDEILQFFHTRMNLLKEGAVKYESDRRNA